MQIQSRSVLPETLPATVASNRSTWTSGTAAGVRADAAVVAAKKLKDATEDFEGMLIGQMLQSIRESSLGGWQEQKDQSGATALEMAESQLSKVMASNGGLGLAKSLQQSLKPQAASQALRQSEASSPSETPKQSEAPSSSGRTPFQKLKLAAPALQIAPQKMP